MFSFKPKSFHFQWHITERCNLRCKHCYQDPSFLKQEVSTQELIKILEDFIKQIKEWNLPKERVRISFTGGEPFIRKDFFKLLNRCYQNRSKFRYGILTNGTLLNKEIIKKLKSLKVDYVQISLEGTEKVNDSVRGKGVFKKAVKAMKLLKNEGMATNFSMTVSRVNLKEVPRLVSLSKKLGTILAVRRCVPCGSGKALKDSLLTPKEVRSLWHYILKTKKTLESQIGLGCEDGMLVQDFSDYRPGECSAGYVSFTVLPNGDVYPCRRLPIWSGNLLKQSFETIYYNSKPLQELRNRNNINDVCYFCSHYEKCHGGAKCIAFSYFGDASSPDPQCWRLFEKLPDSKLKWRNSVRRRRESLNPRYIEAAV